MKKSVTIVMIFFVSFALMFAAYFIAIIPAIAFDEDVRSTPYLSVSIFTLLSLPVGGAHLCRRVRSYCPLRLITYNTADYGGALSAVALANIHYYSIEPSTLIPPEPTGVFTSDVLRHTMLMSIILSVIIRAVSSVNINHK